MPEKIYQESTVNTMAFVFVGLVAGWFFYVWLTYSPVGKNPQVLSLSSTKISPTHKENL